MSEWISVKDRLPELDQKVLVVSATYPNKINGAVRRFEDIGWYWEQHHSGDLNDDGNYEFDDDYTYTHWMPLPEPPEDKP